MLAGVESALPPIIVHSQTMRVIDGMHRLRAAVLRGQTEIDVQYFHGSDQDAFILAVQTNITHGLPLTLPDRTAAAARIVVSRPLWSDQVIALAVGLSHQTVGEIRRCATGDNDQLHTRIGRDGRARPLNSANERRLAEKLTAENLTASFRQTAKAAGKSPEKIRDVRDRMNQGKDPVPTSHRKETNVRRAKIKTRVPLDPRGIERTGDLIPVLQVLRNEPCLPHNELERVLLLLLDMSTALVRERDALVENMPSHLASLAAERAYECAVAWQILGEKLQCAGGKAGEHSTTEVPQQGRDVITTSSIGNSSLGG
jgi:ParB-like chromosome segregation protein Spo0J